MKSQASLRALQAKVKRTQTKRAYGTRAETVVIVQTLINKPHLTYKEIGALHGRSTYAIGAIALRNGLKHGRHGHGRGGRSALGLVKLGSPTVTHPRKALQRKNEEKIIKYVQAHPEMTYKEISSAFGIAPHTVGYLIYRSGVRRTAVTEEAKQRKRAIAEFAKSHPEMTYSDMSRELNLPTLFISNTARQFGLYRGKGQGPRHNGGRAGRMMPWADRQRLSDIMTEVWKNVPSIHRKRLSHLMRGRWDAESKEKFSGVLKKMWKDTRC